MIQDLISSGVRDVQFQDFRFRGVGFGGIGFEAQVA